MDDQSPIRLGIIGLGKLWETRHRPALERMRDRFRIVTVYDQVQERARRTAAKIRCKHAESLSAAVNPDLVDAIYLLSPQWFDSYPIELAAQFGLPVYTSVPIVSEMHASKIQQFVHSGKIQFMPEFARRQYPASRRLHELIENHIGPVRMILGQTRIAAFDRYGQPGPNSQNIPVALRVDPMYFLTDWARYVIQDNPTEIIQSDIPIQIGNDQEANRSETDFCSFTLKFQSGALAQMTCYRHQQSLWGDVGRVPPSPGYQVFAESGMAVLEMPDFIRWHDNSGYHEERLPMNPSLGEILNDLFYQLVRSGKTVGPTIDDVVMVNKIISANGTIKTR
jgi:predicted dehydrogenase